jgi:hypothetical protein
MGKKKAFLFTRQKKNLAATGKTKKNSRCSQAFLFTRQKKQTWQQHVWKKKNLTLFTSLHTHDSLLQARHHLLLTNLMCVYSERERRGEGGAEGNGDGEERERERRER